MNKPAHDFIQNILLEACLDARIPNGIIEISNSEHVEILAEHMFDHGMEPQFVMEVVNGLIKREGKYPDRQAYNKDGWLVTFPSADYRNAAIQKHTHFPTDPTHGKGGMNLYYKKKGKHARQAQQPTSVHEPEHADDGQSSLPPSVDKGGQATTQTTQGKEPEKTTEPAPITTTPTAPEKTEPAGGEEKSELPAAGDEKAPSTTPPAATGGSSETPSASTSVGTEPVTHAPVSPPPAAGTSLVPMTKKFATEKGWWPTPYGEWHDLDSGETKAVTGIDGQVVPINHVDRETLKTFVEKNGQQ